MRKGELIAFALFIGGWGWANPVAADSSTAQFQTRPEASSSRASSSSRRADDESSPEGVGPAYSNAAFPQVGDTPTPWLLGAGTLIGVAALVAVGRVRKWRHE